MKRLFVSLATILTCSSCSAGYKEAGEISFDDAPLYIKKTKDYEGFLGSKRVYCLAGKYRNIKEGQAVDLKNNIYTFSIATALNKFPQLEDTMTIVAAGKQQENFRRRHSRLYDKDQWTRYYSAGSKP